MLQLVLVLALNQATDNKITYPKKADFNSGIEVEGVTKRGCYRSRGHES